MSTTTDLQLKVNDVFSFQFNDLEFKKRGGNPYHCFDGRFIVKQRDNGDLYFLDTYWASKHDGFKHWGDHRWYYPDSALQMGGLTFICNLDEVEEIQEYDLMYYADEDVFDLSYQHGCYKYFVKKKGAVRSQAKMVESAKEKIERLERDIAFKTNTLKQTKETLAKIEAGDTTIYI